MANASRIRPIFVPLCHPYESALTDGDQVVVFCVDCAIAAALGRDATARGSPTVEQTELLIGRADRDRAGDMCPRPRGRGRRHSTATEDPWWRRHDHSSRQGWP